uniref:REC8 meiotic recombination protein b n=1 Tax=Astyanax mexicanus TaxID=7994 RepID=A0A8B9GZ26_ASTMX
MFYYPNVLQRHTGCFSTICEDIIDYVKVQVPPIHPNLPRPRFSLYLSCQLQYGVILVYHRQCGFLLEEVQQAIRHLLRSERHSKIDMQEPDRLGLNLPDSLFLLEEAEGALAPFFGKMGDECEMPSPYQLPQVGKLAAVLKTAVIPHMIHKVKHQNNAQIIFKLNTSPETITIRDKEPVPILTAEFGGAELPEATAYDIDLLMEQQDQFFLGEVEDKERERAGDGETTRELGAAMVSIEQSWTVENPERPLEATKSKARVETTPPPVTLPDTTEASERDLEPEKDTEHCSRKQGRRRQLIFIDQHTQISQDAMREQINKHLIEPRSPVCVPLITTCTHMCLCLLDLSINPCALISQSCVLRLHYIGKK